MTPLHFAAEAGCWDSCWLLLAAGACSAAVDDSGRVARDAVPEEFTKTREEQRKWDELLRPGPPVACPVLATNNLEQLRDFQPIAEDREQPGNEVRPGNLEQPANQADVAPDVSLEKQQPDADADKSLVGVFGVVSVRGQGA